jgi:FlaA1/EpsC-like NDP-sugar epimerase
MAVKYCNQQLLLAFIKNLRREKIKMNRKIKTAATIVVSALTGAVVSFVITQKSESKKTNSVRWYSDKHLSLFLMMNQWVKVKQEGKNIATYFEKNGYKNIAIYGMGYAGKTLLEELNGTDINVAYAIDRNADNICTDVDVVLPDEELEDVDVIVVTAIANFDEVEDMLSEKTDCPIISLEDVLYEV